MKRFLVSTILFLAILSIPERGLTDLWTRYLAGRSVAAMDSDSERSLIWFATRNSGAFSFNGTGFESFNTVSTNGGLVNDSLTSVYVDANGELWFGTLRKGISRFNPNSEVWTTYTINDGLASNRIKTITGDRNGNIWFATADSGVSSFDRKSLWTRYDETNRLSGNNVLSIVVDEDDNKWFGTRQRGVSILKNNDDWCYFLPKKTIESIFIDSKIVWLGTAEGAYKLTIENGLSCSEVPVKVLSPGATINSIVTDANGNIWLATNEGSARLNSSETRLRSFNDEASLGLTIVDDILRDNEDNLWFGMDFFQGVIKYSANWETYTLEDGLESDIIEVIVEDAKGQIWAGTEYGFSRFDDSFWQTHLFDDFECFQQNYITAAAFDDSGGIWLGTLECGVMFAASEADLESPIFYTKENTNDSLASNFITDIAVFGDEVWFATNGGLNLFKPNAGRKWWKWTASETGLIENRLNAVEIDQSGAVWVGSLSGVNRFDRETWQRFITRDGLSGNWINDIKIDEHDGKIWFATNGSGVSIYTPKDGSWQTLSKNDGLADDFVNSISFDKAGVWFGTSNGVSFLDKNETWITLTTADGLGGNLVKTTLHSSDGRLWFGATLGFVTRYTKRTILPKTFILNNFDVTASSKIEYQFIGSDFGTATGQLRYAYKLDKQDYSEWTFDTFATFNVTETGPHTFSVKTMDKDGNENDDSPATDIFYKVNPEIGIYTDFVDLTFLKSDSINIRLYWPPYQLQDTSQVSIQVVKRKELEPDLLFAFDLLPALPEIERKGLVLTFEFPDFLAKQTGQFAIFREPLTPGQSLLKIGGSQQNDSFTKRVSLTSKIDKLGRYGVREIAGTLVDEVEQLTLSPSVRPRVFSPQGGGHGERTHISFTMRNPGNVSIKVYNLAGRLVKTVLESSMSSGVHTVTWNGLDREGTFCPTGVYIIVINSNEINPLPRPLKVMVLNNSG